MGCFDFLVKQGKRPQGAKDDSTVYRTVLLKLYDDDVKIAYSLLEELGKIQGIQASLQVAGAPGMTKEETQHLIGCPDWSAGFTHIATIIASDVAGLHKCTASAAHGKLIELATKDNPRMPIVIDAAAVSRVGQEGCKDGTKADKVVDDKCFESEHEPHYDKSIDSPDVPILAESKSHADETIEQVDEVKKHVHVVSPRDVKEIPLESHKVKPASCGIFGFGAPGAPALVWRGAATSVHARGEWDGWLEDLVLTPKNPGGDWHVELPKSWKGMHYKFVVDGVWMVDDTQATELCASGHINNVYPGYNEHLRSSSRPNRIGERGEAAPRERRRR